MCNFKIKKEVSPIKPDFFIRMVLSRKNDSINQGLLEQEKPGI